MKNARERMDILAAYRQVGSYRGAAAICGTTHKTVKRVVERHEAGGAAAPRRERARNYDPVREVVAEQVAKTHGRISAKRLLPAARTAGYEGSARNFRRLVAAQKALWRRGNHRGRRPAVWTPGDTLAIDWGVQDGLHVFCAVLAWSRFRFVRFAADEKSTTTLGMLAECFEVLGGVPATVLADRMGCLKAAVVADVVVPTADYVRFATHYGFRPDFCRAADPESKGIVEALVGYAKRDLMVPLTLQDDLPQDLPDRLAAVNEQAAGWCGEVNAVVHSEICAVPAQRLEVERGLLKALPSLRPEIGARPVTRKVDRLSCVRFGSARYSVPNRLIGDTVFLAVLEGRVQILERFTGHGTGHGTGEVVAEHPLVAPGETSILDEHYGSSRPDKPRRAPRARTGDEQRFLALGPTAGEFLTGAAAAGVANLARELRQILTLHAAHGPDALHAALARAVEFGRWRADDVRSILAAGGAAPTPRPAGQALVLTLPSALTAPTRSLDEYAISNLDNLARGTSATGGATGGESR
ncbi:MAG: IS21 family transposase [Actinobacteria bacterium]|nr:IS21 family transposase [Actinomycetota bacterium]